MASANERCHSSTFPCDSAKGWERSRIEIIALKDGTKSQVVIDHSDNILNVIAKNTDSVRSQPHRSQHRRFYAHLIWSSFCAGTCVAIWIHLWLRADTKDVTKGTVG